MKVTLVGERLFPKTKEQVIAIAVHQLEHPRQVQSWGANIPCYCGWDVDKSWDAGSHRKYEEVAKDIISFYLDTEAIDRVQKEGERLSSLHDEEEEYSLKLANIQQILYHEPSVL